MINDKKNYNFKNKIFCSRFAFKLYSSEHYLMDGKQLRGKQNTDIRTLERIGYDVIAVNVDSFEQMPEKDRPSYLLKLISQKKRT